MLKRKDVKELTLLIILSAIFLVAFNKFMYLIWDFIAWMGGYIL